MKSNKKVVKQREEPRDVKGVVKRITENPFVLILGLLLSIYALLEICYKAVNYLSPKLDIVVYDVLWSSEPFSAPIILKNTGGVSINNITLSYKISNYKAAIPAGPKIEMNESTINRSLVLAKLKPGDSKTLDFSFINPEAHSVCNTKPSIEITIKYEKYFRSHIKTSKFKTEKYESGKFVWLPD